MDAANASRVARGMDVPCASLEPPECTYGMTCANQMTAKRGDKPVFMDNHDEESTNRVQQLGRGDKAAAARAERPGARLNAQH